MGVLGFVQIDLFELRQLFLFIQTPFLSLEMPRLGNTHLFRGFLVQRSFFVSWGLHLGGGFPSPAFWSLDFQDLFMFFLAVLLDLGPSKRQVFFVGGEMVQPLERNHFQGLVVGRSDCSELPVGRLNGLRMVLLLGKLLFRVVVFEVK